MNARFSPKSGRPVADIRITQPEGGLGSIPAWAVSSPKPKQDISISPLASKTKKTPRLDQGSTTHGSKSPNIGYLGSGVSNYLNDPVEDRVSSRTSHGKSGPVGYPVERLLTVVEAAEVFAVSTKTLRRLINRGDLPTVRIGRSVRITQEALIAFIEGRRS